LRSTSKMAQLAFTRNAPQLHLYWYGLPLGRVTAFTLKVALRGLPLPRGLRWWFALPPHRQERLQAVHDDRRTAIRVPTAVAAPYPSNCENDPVAFATSVADGRDDFELPDRPLREFVRAALAAWFRHGTN
jgi:hypothetical protein